MARLSYIMAFLFSIPLEIMAEAPAQQTHVAQLGDPCYEPGDCRVPNSECVQTDNLYWNRQNFCVCRVGFHPSTGFCVADTGADNSLVKLEYQQPAPPPPPAQPPLIAIPDLSITTSPMSVVNNEDTTNRNSTLRSPLMTAFIPPMVGAQNLLQGFHFGNRTQSIVSNIVEQLTHLRGQQPTATMKEKLETLGLPLLQAPQSYATIDDEDIETTTQVPVSNGDLYLESVTALVSYNVMAINVSITTNSTSQSENTTTPASTSTTTTFSPVIGLVNPSVLSPPMPTKPLPPPKLTMHPIFTNTTPATVATSAPTMATVATQKSENNPFLPPALPPFFDKHTTKHNALKHTISTSTTTLLPVWNVTTPASTIALAADGPDAKLALMRKVQNLIVQASTMPPASTTAESSSFQLNMQPQAPLLALGIGNSAFKHTPQIPPNATTGTGNSSDNSATQSPPPPQPLPPPLPPLNPGKSQTSSQAGIKNLLNNFGMGKSLPIPPQAISNSIFQPSNPTVSPIFDSSSSDRPADFYAVFKSAAENVIREYLGGITTLTPQSMNRVLNGNGIGDATVDKLLEKFIEPKGGGQSSLRTRIGTQVTTATQSTIGSGSNSTVSTSTISSSKASNASVTVTRPRPPFIWRTTGPGQSVAHPLPRIVFTGR